jgi:hypothetical protein
MTKLAYDDAGIRRAMRMATDAATEALLEREQALRAVQTEMPGLDLTDQKDAAGVYFKAIEALACIDMDELKNVDAGSLGAIFKTAVNGIRRNGKDSLATDRSPRGLRVEAEMAARFPNAARIVRQ